jgi:glycosyltransferase involved in cell wall biosynthesis
VYVRLGRVQTLANRGNWNAVRDERAISRGRGPLIAVAKRVRDDFERWHGLELSRVTVISNGATFAAPPRDRAAVREAAGVAADARVLLTIGRPDFVKGHDLLERALKHSAAGGELTWVSVGGSRPTRAPGRVVTGPLSREEVVDWIHAADLGALPSYYEGCSVALLEMLAGGLYTLAHDVGNAAEVIRPGANGAIVERSVEAWRAALSAAATRPPARARPGLDDAYRWPALAERTEAFYRAALARAGGEALSRHSA